MHHAPGLFDEIIAMFIFWGGAEKIIYSDGTSSVIHNRSWRNSGISSCPSALAQIRNQADLQGRQGADSWRQLCARQPTERRAEEEACNDEFSRERKKTGLQKPYSNWLAIYKEQTAAAI